MGNLSRFEQDPENRTRDTLSMMRCAGFALLACLPSALATLFSLEQFKEKYRTSVTDGFGLANEGIMGASEPSSNVALWTWYRNVDASTQSEAKAFMDTKVSAHTSSLVTTTDFATKYTAALTNPVDKGNVDTNAVIMYDVLAATRPSPVPTKKAWDAYQLLNDADKAAVKDEVVYKPFVDGFTSAWTTAWSSATDFKERAALAAGTMGKRAVTVVKDGKDTTKFWTAMADAHGHNALQKVMFSGSNSFADV